MISARNQVTVILLLSVSVAALQDSHPDEEGDSLPHREWDETDQEEMPMKGKKSTAKKTDVAKKTSVQMSEKKTVAVGLRHEDDDADDDVPKAKGAPAPAPLTKEQPMTSVPVEDDADTPAPEGMVAMEKPSKIQDKLGKGLTDMAFDKFEEMIDAVADPIRKELIELIESHDSMLDKTGRTDRAPMMKTYLEIFEPEKYKKLYGSQAESKTDDKQTVMMTKVKDLDTQELHDGKDLPFFMPMSKVDEMEEQAYNNYEKLMLDYEALKADEEDFQSQETAPKEKSKKPNQVRTAAIVDANGNMMFEKDPQEKTLRSADDEDDKSRAAVKDSPDADAAKTTEKPKSVWDDEYKSPEQTQQEAEEHKRLQYLATAGLVVIFLFVVWLYIRHRAQQLIERSTAFDDASSVSSSTLTEENPTVKVNRALLERMANISQKLSEKVEEARASSNADSSSSEGSARQYTRKAKKPLIS